MKESSPARARRGRPALNRLLSLTGAGLVAAACMTLEWEPVGPRRTAQVPGAEREGPEECLACHEEVAGHKRIASYHADCESCHGGGSLHSLSEEAAEIRFPAAEDCLACHQAGRRSHLDWIDGDHARAGLLCSDCHNPHATSEQHLRRARSPYTRDLDAKSSLCVDCHGDVKAQLNFPSHHPLLEGAMGCGSCHDPHAGRRAAQPEDQQLCASCHQDFAGPWIFEHPPAVESCMTCHNPHGAVADKLLETTQPVICLSCHSLNDTFHHDLSATGILGNRTISQDYPESGTGEQITDAEAGTYLRRCTDCHGAIHGSYTDEHLRH